MDDRMAAEAVTAARQLLLNFKVAHPGWANDKTPIDELVFWCGLEVATFNAGDQPQGTYGWLEPGEDLIWLCRDLSETLRRFTLAHELGHAILHRSPTQQEQQVPESCPGDPCQGSDVQETVTGLIDQEQMEEILGTGQSYNPRSQRELAANIFAAELLMPRERVQTLYLQVPPQQLAGIFGVSTLAMLNRLAGLLDEASNLGTPGAQTGLPQAAHPQEELHSTPQKQYDEFQQAAIEAPTPALIVAGPGSGKTSTLIGRAEYLIRTLGIPAQHILALTFSRKAAQEMQERLQRALQATPTYRTPPTVSTFHAFCAELLRSHGERVGLRPDFTFVDEAEGYFLLRQLAGELPLHHYQHLRLPTFYFPDLLQAISRAKDELVTPERYRYLAQQMLEQAQNAEEVQAAEKALEVAAIYARYEVALQQRGDTDFGGLIMLTTQLLQEHPEVLQEQQQRYRHILVDEFQDMNRASGVLLRLLAGEQCRVWVVGDANQCQPAGTMIRLPDGSECPIEDIQPNRNVVTYDRDSTMFVKKGQVTDVAVRHYHGMLYTVKAGDKQTRCTDSHKWLVRWTNTGQTAWITYLMRQGNRYRVGQTQLFLKPQKSGRKTNGNLSLGLRVRQEKADAVWIIKVHNTLADALVYEQILAAKYGLPEVVFNQSYSTKCFTQEMIDKIYDALSPLENAARRCLEDHGRKFEYPLYSREGSNGVQNEKRQRRGRTTIFETQACNLISNFMALPVAPDHIHSKRDHSMRRVVAQSWQPVEVTSEEFSGPVYSLNIAKYHKYIADGLVTCNSIYTFRGASPANIASFKNDYPGATISPLNRNYRSRPDIVSLADAFRRQQMEPGTEQAARHVVRPTQPGGYVTLATAVDEASELAGLIADMRYKKAQHGYTYRDMVVLCRTRAQARKVAQALALAGLPVIGRGSRSMLEQEHIRDVLSIVLLLVEPSGMGILRAARQSEHTFTQSDVETLLLAAREQSHPAGSLIARAEAPANLSGAGRRSLLRLADILQVLSHMPDVWSMLAQYLLIETSLVRALLGGSDAPLPEQPLPPGWGQAPPLPYTAGASRSAYSRGDPRGRPETGLADYARLLELARYYDQRQQKEEAQAQSVTSSVERAQGFLDYLHVMAILRQDGNNRREGAESNAEDAPDGIRVMTVHASKGLEFPVVYLPGLAQRRFPLQARSSPISAPQGMLSMAGDGQLARTSNEGGEACLFYVGMTRARDHLVLSYSERYGKQNYKPSLYLDILAEGLPTDRLSRIYWQGAAEMTMQEEEEPENAAASWQPGESFIEAMESKALSVSAIETYQICPRRYAYSNIYRFQREENTYQLFWQATRKTLEALQLPEFSREQEQGAENSGARFPTRQEAQDLYMRHWRALGGHESPFAPLYEQHGREIVDSLWLMLAGEKQMTWELQRSFEVEVAGRIIRVEVDRIEASSQVGKPVRFVRTRLGKSAGKATAEIRELLYAHAYRQRHPGQGIEVHHHNLSTGEMFSIKLTEKREQKLLAELAQTIKGLEQHVYPATPDSFICPNCPFFLICPA